MFKMRPMEQISLIINFLLLPVIICNRGVETLRNIDVPYENLSKYRCFTISNDDAYASFLLSL